MTGRAGLLDACKDGSGFRVFPEDDDAGAVVGSFLFCEFVDVVELSAGVSVSDACGAVQ